MTEWRKVGESPRPMMARAAAEVQPLAQVVGDIPDEHVITVAERRVSVDYPTIIQNNMNTDTIGLVLDGEWDGMSVVCYIGHPGDLGEFEWEGEPFTLPVYDTTGSIDVTVVGLSADGKTRLVTVEAKGVMNVIKSGEFEGSVPPEDQPDLLGQILAAKGEAEDAADAANSAASTANSAASSANSAASSANSASTSANSAATKANSAAVDAQNAYDTLQPYMATIDSCANILHREAGPDSVITADDSFPCKPVEMTVYGNTVQNLWVNPSALSNGVTATSNEDGSLTMSGTATKESSVSSTYVYSLKPDTTYTVAIDKKPEGFSARVSESTGTAHYFTSKTTFTTDADMEYCVFILSFNDGANPTGTYRVMLNEGSEAEPWCPPGLNSVGQLREDEKNLWVNPSGTDKGQTVTPNDDGSFTISGEGNGTTTNIDSERITLTPGGQYTISIDKERTYLSGLTVGSIAVREFNSSNTQIAYNRVGGKGNLSTTFTVDSAAAYVTCAVAVGNSSRTGTYKVMLNEGSTASPWVPPESESCVQVLTAGKNLITVKPGFGVTNEGVTYDYLGDGAFHVHGTASDRSYCPVDYTANIGYLNYESLRGKTLTASRDSDVVGCYFDYFVGQVGGAYEAMISLVSGESASAVVPDDATWARSVLTVASGTTVDEIVHVQLELGSTATAYEPPNITTTPIDLQGHTLNALPDGTRDELHIDGGGNVVLEKRVGSVDSTNSFEAYGATSPCFGCSDAPYSIKGRGGSLLANGLKVTSSVSTSDWLNYTAGLASNDNITRVYVKGAEDDATASDLKSTMEGVDALVLYPLLEPQTISLGTITPPTMAAPNVTAYVADDTPAEMSLDYVRDVNIVHSRLEERVAALELASATS